ncbi:MULTISPECIES: DUF378 domain-containing protein [Caproicibacterium]|jgi:hypothetical protein|uniref:DUF378 domain-containing protein n=1 Tax=Caproicibacterium lactatifermentans TaxID=2666138 RepID=A0A859DS82_9FIRM|nr:DUF378 domain-containing protein [Caproicibacterium lactatifermentans]ARP51180.1 DUF378 domain-containing protein [Ruminococcaceae bacterium CPB6]MDD4806987.1 DUF378 domain-containing protein [Oscillospiraceae bacterium]QKN24680.1 DUF378 domain-containing protein [Caproicibacterium lactatifermentans]QKO30179.1 DUF378 domain-containing protein [Caproicibacterium lactatifermentans]
MLDKIALFFIVVGGINWGLVGFFRFDLVAWICGGPATMLARIIYAVIGIAALWSISIFFKRITTESDIEHGAI